MNSPRMKIKMLITVSVVILALAKRRPSLICQNAMAQNMKPKKESKAEDMMLRKEPILGMTLQGGIVSTRYDTAQKCEKLLTSQEQRQYPR